MGLFPNIFSRRLVPSWQFSAKGVIWRVFPSENGYFVGEDRDIAGKTVSFFCIERQNGKILWEGSRSIDPWWVTLDAIHGNVILLHGYAEPDMPEPRKIYAIDLLSGRPLWSDESLRFLFADTESFYVAREDILGLKFFRVAPGDGSIKEEVQSDELHRLKKTIHQEDDRRTIFPVPLGSSGDTRQDIERIVKRKQLRSSRITGVEFIRSADMTVVGYYKKQTSTGSEERLTHHLAFFGPNGSEKYDECIDTDVIAPVPDSFFRLSDMLYFIRDKKILAAVHLSSAGRN
jgi:hypothetical protein